ncbi:xanthine dehydrogenase small subunit [Paracoccaceae bacterium GXU_MW_L88]
MSDVQTRREMRLLLNDQPITLREVASRDTLLDFLRIERRLKGTKEGCAEGDCGACTVLVGQFRGGALVYEPVNACIRLLPTLDSCHVVTVEHLAEPGGALNPVQEAMVKLHGSQCGFCTPGIVVTLFALLMNVPDPSVDQIEEALQGNLCRCTGYGPIIAAAQEAAREGGVAARLESQREAVSAQLHNWADGARVEVERDGDRAILPASVDDFAAVYEAHPDATIVAGATDVGLWITKFLKDISPAIFIAHLDDLRQMEVSGGKLTLGAGASYTDCQALLAEHFPHLGPFWARIAGWQVRNMGTVGGNIANGSPIGDTPPTLIALGATLTLRKGDARRTIPLEDFFIDYGKQDRAKGEFVEAIHIPLPNETARSGAYKISKRRESEISSVCGAITVEVEGDTITSARIAFGGMAATPKRARHAETALKGQPWHEDTVRAAMDAIAKDYDPISDHRASAEYRADVAANLLMRFWLEQGGSDVRLIREAAE